MLPGVVLPAVILTLLLVPAMSVAQDAPPPPPPAREGTVNASFVATTGNSDAQSIGLDGDLIFRPGQWEVRNKAAFVRIETNDLITAQSFAYLSRAARKLTSRLSAYGQYDYLRDRPGGIRHRNVGTGGLSLRVIERERHLFDVFGGLGYANEQRVTEDEVSTAVFDSGTTYKWKFSDVAEFSDDLRFNQSLSDGDDWRLGHLAAITAKLTTLFSIKVSYDVRYRNAPPVGFETTDSATAVALVAKF
jgi:putative salt-induced outer membrane protein YdiY